MTGEAQVFLWGCFVGVIIIQTKMSINHHIIEEYMFFVCMYSNILLYEVQQHYSHKFNPTLLTVH